MKYPLKFRKSLLGLFLLLSQFAFGQSQKEWTNLFDGKTLNGWSVLDKPANVRIENNSMVLHMTAHTSRHAFIRTNKKFKDFIFEVEFRRDLTIDSGILFRAIDAPDTAFNALFGYMVKIDPSLTRLWTGGVFLDYGNGLQWLHPLDGNEKARHAENTVMEWNQLRIEASGEEISVFLNGVPTVHLLDDKFKKGYIAFKIHYLQAEKEKEALEIAYRNPRILTKSVKKYRSVNDLPLVDSRGINKITYFR